jgi:2-polyprenyl-6-methoxyphenol hydroxylase-like FAD-dependent oxidoreductase
MSRWDVVVVGGGVAGLGLACALSRLDLCVLVLEPRRRSGGIHRGDSLLPKATAALARWGVLERLRARGAVPIVALELHDGREKLFEGPLSGNTGGAPYLVLPHAEIEQGLAEACVASGRVTLLRGARVVALLRDPGGRVMGARYRTSTAPGASSTVDAEARLVVGADGHRSLVRRELGISSHRIDYDHAYLGLEADRPPGYRDAMRVHLHPDGGVLVMPRPTRVGLGILVEAARARELSGRSDAELSAQLARRAPLLEGVRLHRQGEHVYLLSQSHATKYHRDGAVLLGDAAHTSNPTAGQGMASALADAAALADAVGPALAAGERRLDDALSRFERTVRPENERLLERAHLLATVYALRGHAWHAVKTGIVRALGGGLATRVASPILQRFLQPRAASALPLAS